MSRRNHTEMVEVAEELEAELTVGSECLHVAFSGEIDTDIATEPLQREGVDHLILDLDGVDRITSYGIQAWLKFHDEIDVGYVCFLRARPSLVGQFNMVHNFSVGGELLSLYLPYRCPNCGGEFEHAVDARRDYNALTASEVPDVACPSCAEPARFQDVPELYLEFIRSQGPPNPPDAVVSWLDGGDEKGRSGTSDSESFRVSKEIVGELTVLWASGRLEDAPRLERIAEGIEGQSLMICTELDEIEPQGLRSFDDMIDERLLLARVSRELLGTFADEERVHPHVRPVAIRVPVRCLECDWSSEEDVELAAVVDRDSVDVSRGCPDCHSDLRADVSDRQRERYRRFDVPALPSEIASFLNHCEVPPEERSGRRGEVENVVGQSFGSYTLKQKIGSGGMAEIFLARHEGAEGFERDVVIKRLSVERGANPDLVDSFVREAKYAARLSHPNVVQVTDFGRTNQFYYIVMEYVDGPDFGDVLSKLRSMGAHMPAKYAVFIGVRMCDVLHAAHTMRDADGEPTPIIHRDVSPQNILISSHGTPKLTDFGIARVLTGLERRSAGIVPGKIAYLSPESVQPRFGPLDDRADIFSLGAVLYEFLTNEKPFDGENRQATLRAVLTDRAPDVTDVRPDLPAQFNTILAEAMAKRPRHRYETVRDFREPLDRMLRRLGVVTEFELGEWMVDVMTGSYDPEEVDSAEDLEVGASPESADEEEGIGAASTVPTSVDGDGATSSTASVPIPGDVDAGRLSARILVVARQRGAEGGNLAQIATAAVDEVDAIGGLGELQESPEAYEIVLFDWEGFEDEERNAVFEAFEQHREDQRFLVVSRSVRPSDFSELFGEIGLTNLVAHHRALDRLELFATLKKTMHREIFGFDKYFSWGSTVETSLIESTEQIETLKASAREFVQGPQTSGRHVRDFERVTEELVLNAIYNAPVEQGERIYADLPRSETVELAPEERVEVSFCHEGERAGVAVRDPFGSLTVDQLLDYLSRSANKTDAQVDRGSGGSGVGLFQSFRGLSHMVVNVERGTASEFIGIVHLHDDYSEFASRPKSFNVFVG